MIHLFNRKELIVVQSGQRLHQLTGALSAAGIPYRTKWGSTSFFTADRYHGTPFLNSDAPQPCKIYVNRADYDHAVSVLHSVR